MLWGSCSLRRETQCLGSRLVPKDSRGNLNDTYQIIHLLMYFYYKGDCTTLRYSTALLESMHWYVATRSTCNDGRCVDRSAANAHSKPHHLDVV